MPKKRYPRFLQAADQAVIVEFGETIDPVVNRQVIGLDQDLARQPLEGVLETIPTYRSLFIRYDPTRRSSASLIDELQCRMTEELSDDAERRLWTVPVFYGGEAGMDLEDVASLHGLSVDEVIALHSNARYRVYMIGFMPGFAYLGGLPDAIHTPRLTNPRPLTPAGGIAIGGMQASINSVASPSGWRFIGRTPLRLFDPKREPAILLRAGDEIQFECISEDEAARLDALTEAGKVTASCKELR